MVEYNSFLACCAVVLPTLCHGGNLFPYSLSLSCLLPCASSPSHLSSYRSLLPSVQVSGFEIIAILWFSPIVMVIGPIRRGLTSPLGLMLMRLCMMIGVASYQAPSTLSRLIILGVGNMFAMLVLAGSWWDKSKLDR